MQLDRTLCPPEIVFWPPHSTGPVLCDGTSLFCPTIVFGFCLLLRKCPKTANGRTGVCVGALCLPIPASICASVHRSSPPPSMQIKIKRVLCFMTHFLLCVLCLFSYYSASTPVSVALTAATKENGPMQAGTQDSEQ